MSVFGRISGHLIAAREVATSHDARSDAWVYAPPEQPEWQTDGLLEAAMDLRRCDIDSD